MASVCCKNCVSCAGVIVCVCLTKRPSTAVGSAIAACISPLRGCASCAGSHVSCCSNERKIAGGICAIGTRTSLTTRALLCNCNISCAWSILTAVSVIDSGLNGVDDTGFCLLAATCTCWFNCWPSDSVSAFCNAGGKSRSAIVAPLDVVAGD